MTYPIQQQMLEIHDITALLSQSTEPKIGIQYIFQGTKMDYILILYDDQVG